MKTVTQFHAPPHSINRLTFDLQRFAEFVDYIGADGNTCTAEAYCGASPPL